MISLLHHLIHSSATGPKQTAIHPPIPHLLSITTGHRGISRIRSLPRAGAFSIQKKPATFFLACNPQSRSPRAAPAGQPIDAATKFGGRRSRHRSRISRLPIYHTPESLAGSFPFPPTRLFPRFTADQRNRRNFGWLLRLLRGYYFPISRASERASGQERDAKEESSRGVSLRCSSTTSACAREFSFVLVLVFCVLLPGCSARRFGNIQSLAGGRFRKRKINFLGAASVSPGYISLGSGCRCAAL